MKPAITMFVAWTILLLPNLPVYSETVYQTIAGSTVDAGDGRNIETMTSAAATDSSKALRVKGAFPQWASVLFRFGPPVPTGKAVVRFKVYIDGTDTATYALYLVAPTGHDYEVGIFQIPADAEAKKNSCINVDVPINAAAEWSELLLKKTEKSDKPSPWIGSISIILP
jgi:hypothetical protein